MKKDQSGEIIEDTPSLILCWDCIRGDVKIPTYRPHTNHKKPSVSSHTLAPTTICDLSHSDYGSPLRDLGHISSVTYICHPLWFVCGHRKGILTSPLSDAMMSNPTVTALSVPQRVAKSSYHINTQNVCVLYNIILLRGDIKLLFLWLIIVYIILR